MKYKIIRILKIDNIDNMVYIREEERILIPVGKDLTKIFEGHPDLVKSVAFSPDGKYCKGP